MMRVGVLKIYLEITNSISLKDKRMVLNSLKQRLKNNFNISVAEVEDNDKLSKSVMGIAACSNDSKFLDMVFSKVLDFIDSEKSILLLDSYKEIL